MIEDYLQQTASWKAVTGTNAAAEKVHGAAQTIDVRWFYEIKLVRDDQGRETVSSAHVSAKEAIGNGDLITDEEGREREVITVRKNRDVDGVFSHYVAFIK